MLIPNLLILVCANQASEEGLLPSHYLPTVVSTTSSPFLVVASTKISGLINTTTSKNIAKGSIQTQSTTNGINVGKLPSLTANLASTWISEGVLLTAGYFFFPIFWEFDIKLTRITHGLDCILVMASDIITP